MNDQRGNGASNDGAGNQMLFWGCFMALVATAFSFVVRGLVIDEWAAEFNLSDTQKGEILGVGLWPFAVTIVLFSLVIDKIGYGKAMVFAFACQVGGCALTIFAEGYESLYAATLMIALGNGTVEAVINPVVATMYAREKTKWLSILHAGWPGGLVLGGILAIFLGTDVAWEWKVGLMFLPAAIYGLMLVGRHFPVQERVQAGVSFKAMMQEAGVISCLIIVGLMVAEVGRFFEVPPAWQLGVGAVLVIAYGVYVRSLGRFMFIFLVLIMMPLAITELGTDSWITPLMTAEMARLELHPGWVLVYTSLIMMILRFFAGPIVHRLSPLGLLAVSSLLAMIGLLSLSATTGLMILVAATIYGFGKTFFWPAMLGVVSEQFPGGGALTLNLISGVGVLCVGIIGTPFLGRVQDEFTNTTLEERDPILYQKVVAEDPKASLFGKYVALDQGKIETVTSEAEKKTIAQISEEAGKKGLRTVAICPLIMLICYLGLMLYFRAQGGYKAQVLTGHAAEDEKFTGGTEGPGEG